MHLDKLWTADFDRFLNMDLNNNPLDIYNVQWNSKRSDKYKIEYDKSNEEVVHKLGGRVRIRV